MTQATLWHQHDPVVMHMKNGERWTACRTCGQMLEVRREVMSC